MKLLYGVPKRKSETLLDRLNYCRLTLQEHGILDITQSITALHTLKNKMDEEDIELGGMQF